MVAMVATHQQRCSREEVLDEAIVIATGQVVEILLMDIVEAQVVGHFKCLHRVRERGRVHREEERMGGRVRER